LDKNKNLLIKIRDYEVLKKENMALNDQFHSSFSRSLDLLKADIIGSWEESFVINKGSKDGLKVGQGVLSGDFVVGKIAKISQNLSVVSLIIDSSLAFSALDLETNALGVARGGGDHLLLSETLLSETLKVSDTIVTKGDMDESGIGYPPNLIVGRIAAVEKNPSALFQSAKVKSPIDFSKLSTVFVILGIK